MLSVKIDTGPGLTLAGLAVAAGCGLIAVAALEPSKTPRAIWANIWLDAGLGCMALGLLIGGFAFYTYLWPRTQQIPSEEPRPKTITLLGGILGGNSNVKIDSSADSFAVGTTFTDNSTVIGTHRPQQSGDQNGQS